MVCVPLFRCASAMDTRTVTAEQLWYVPVLAELLTMLGGYEGQWLILPPHWEMKPVFVFLSLLPQLVVNEVQQILMHWTCLAHRTV